MRASTGEGYSLYDLTEGVWFGIKRETYEEAVKAADRENRRLWEADAWRRKQQYSTSVNPKLTEEQLAYDREPIPFTPVKRLQRDDILYVTEETRPHPIEGYHKSHKEYAVIDLRGYRRGYEPRLEIKGIYTPTPNDIFRLHNGHLPPYQPTTTGDKLLSEMRRLSIHSASRIAPARAISSQTRQYWVRIDNPGDSSFVQDALVSYEEFEKEREKILDRGGKPPSIKVTVEEPSGNGHDEYQAATKTHGPYSVYLYRVGIGEPPELKIFKGESFLDRKEYAVNFARRLSGTYEDTYVLNNRGNIVAVCYGKSGCVDFGAFGREPNKWEIEKLKLGEYQPATEEIEHYYWVEKNEPYDTWAIIEAWPGGSVRSPYSTREEAIKAEEEIAADMRWRLKQVPSPREKFPKQHEALKKLYPYIIAQYHDDGDLTIRELLPISKERPGFHMGNLYVVTTDGEVFEETKMLMTLTKGDPADILAIVWRKLKCRKSKPPISLRRQHSTALYWPEEHKITIREDSWAKMHPAERKLVVVHEALHACGAGHEPGYRTAVDTMAMLVYKKIWGEDEDWHNFIEELEPRVNRFLASTVSVDDEELTRTVYFLAQTEGDPIRKFCCRFGDACAPPDLLEEGKFPERISWLRHHYNEKHPGMWGKKYPEVNYKPSYLKEKVYGPPETAALEVKEIWRNALKETEAKYPIGHPLLVAEAKRAGVSQEETQKMIAHEIYLERRRALLVKWTEEYKKEEPEEEETNPAAYPEVKYSTLKEGGWKEPFVFRGLKFREHSEGIGIQVYHPEQKKWYDIEGLNWRTSEDYYSQMPDVGLWKDRSYFGSIKFPEEKPSYLKETEGIGKLWRRKGIGLYEEILLEYKGEMLPFLHSEPVPGKAYFGSRKCPVTIDTKRYIRESVTAPFYTGGVKLPSQLDQLCEKLKDPSYLKETEEEKLLRQIDYWQKYQNKIQNRDVEDFTIAIRDMGMVGLWARYNIPRYRSYKTIGSYNVAYEPAIGDIIEHLLVSRVVDPVEQWWNGLSFSEHYQILKELKDPEARRYAGYKFSVLPKFGMDKIREYYKEKHPGMWGKRQPATVATEYFADSAEFLAQTMEATGYREKLDSAFKEAIARVKK